MVVRASVKRREEREEPRDEPIEDRVKPVPKPSTGIATVVVACKIPNGVILRSFEMVKKSRIVAGNVFTEEQAEERGPRFTVRGPALGFGQIPNISIVGGYALTVGVPRDLCEIWFKQNADADMVRNKLIFWESSVERATDRAKELQATKSGLEPMDPNSPPAEFARGLSKITKADLSDNDMKIAST